MDTEVPVYGTNGSGAAAQQHHNIFDMYQSFLGHFWGSNTGMTNMKDAEGLVSQIFPGMQDKMDQAQGALNDPSNPVSQIFGSLMKGL